MYIHTCLSQAMKNGDDAHIIISWKHAKKQNTYINMDLIVHAEHYTQ